MNEEEIVFSKMVKGNYYKIAGLGFVVRRMFNDDTNECVIVADLSQFTLGKFFTEPTKYKYINASGPNYGPKYSTNTNKTL
jgi:hypothetical protein